MTGAGGAAEGACTAQAGSRQALPVSGMTGRPVVSAIIPAWNEEDRIGATVEAVRRAGFAGEVLVVDDGSADGTATAAEAAGARVLRLGVNVGKGGAMHAGAMCAVGEVLLFLDADLGCTADAARALLEPVLSGQADMTVAVFPRRGKGGGFGLAVGLARWGIRMLTGRVMAAPLSGQRAVSRRCYDAVGPCAAGFGAEVGLTVDALRRGFRVQEVPVEMAHAVTGRDIAGFRHRGRQFQAILRVLLARGLVRALIRGGASGGEGHA